MSLFLHIYVQRDLEDGGRGRRSVRVGGREGGEEEEGE